MCFFPAHHGYSIDVKNKRVTEKDTMYAYIKWVVIFQLFIVYTYAALAKLYSDWLDFSIIKILLSSKAHYYIIGELLQQPWIHKIVGVFGILFDLLVVPALLWKPTRKIAFVCSIFFHLFNSVVFQIGIFPYLSLAFIVFFFEPDTVRKFFFKKKNAYIEGEFKLPAFKNTVLILGSIYFIIQMTLPLRHYFIEDDVLWTEEGHRMSWRMMLRSKGGTIQFKLVNQKTKVATSIPINYYLSKKQAQRIAAYPDFIWQFAQRLKREHAEKGEEVSVYALNSKLSVNGKPYRAFIDPKVDLANVPWNYFGHNDWILPSSKATAKK